MNVFTLRDRLVGEYTDYTSSFITIRDRRIREAVERDLDAGLLWPDPMVQLNPSFEPGETIDELCDAGILHDECRRIFRLKKERGDSGSPLRLHRHQSDAVRVARTQESYVLTTGTGSGKSLAYLIPIVDRVLRSGPGRGIQAIVVYPMNALANSQAGELEKYLQFGYPDGKGPVTFRRYTGQETDEQRNDIVGKPPDVILTNYVMLELILTRPFERRLVNCARGLGFLVLDELHTYRGRQGSDVALLVRRVREACEAPALQCVGTSATLAGAPTVAAQREEIARVATQVFGAEVKPASVIVESLRRATRPADDADPAFVGELRTRITDGHKAPDNLDAFLTDPLARWIEGTFGLRPEDGSGRLVRARPRPVRGPGGAAADLAALTGVPPQACAAAVEETLLAGYSIRHPETRFPVFAFRLHQFFGRGETVYVTPEPGDARHVTTQGQQFVPGDRSRVLLPLAFCRECGQEYYTVTLRSEPGSPGKVAAPRELLDIAPEGGGEVGYLYASSDAPWPESHEEQMDRLPDDWMEWRGDAQAIKRDRTKDLPRPITVRPRRPPGRRRPSVPLHPGALPLLSTLRHLVRDA